MEDEFTRNETDLHCLFTHVLEELDARDFFLAKRAGHLCQFESTDRFVQSGKDVTPEDCRQPCGHCLPAVRHRQEGALDTNLCVHVFYSGFEIHRKLIFDHTSTN